METEFILLILSIISVVFILVVIILAIIWLLINRIALKDKTNALNEPIHEMESQERADKTREQTLEHDELNTDSVVSLRSAQSGEQMEKLMPQKLMTWNQDEADTENSIRSLDLEKDAKTSSLEIRKIESENYITYLSSTDSESGSQKDNVDQNADIPPEAVPFEEDPQNPEETLPPTPPPTSSSIIEDEEYTLEEI